MKTLHSRIWFVRLGRAFACLLLLFTCSLFLLLLIPSPPPLIIEALKDRGARPPLRAWISGCRWQIQNALLRKIRPPKTITVTTLLLSLTNDARTAHSLAQLRGQPQIGAGAKAWLVNEEELQLLKGLQNNPGNKIQSAPTISFADGGAGAVSMSRSAPLNGTNVNVGIDIGIIPRTRRNSTDLDLTILSTDVPDKHSAIVTNIAIAARVQLPKGHGLFILPENPIHPGGARSAFLLNVKVEQSR
jgi:hypothetical protein